MTRNILITIFSIVASYFAYDGFFGIDSNKPDCYGNKAFFKKVLKVDDIPVDVSDIRCYSDHLGANFAEEISFQCDSTTFNQIVLTFDLKHQKDVPNFGRYIYKSLRNEIDTLTALTDYKQKLRSPYHSFWYNPKSRHAYFLTYNL